MPVVGCCRRGTWSCPGMLSEHPGAHLSISRAHAGTGVHSAFNPSQNSASPIPGSASDQPKSTCASSPPPRICRQPKARSVRPWRRDYATASARGPADPVPPTRAPSPLGGESTGLSAPRRRLRRLAEGRQLRLALANAKCPSICVVCRRSGGTGVGRHARQMRGDIMRTCKNLRVRRRSPRVQTGMYHRLYPWRPSFPF